jgi:cytochrome c553
VTGTSRNQPSWWSLALALVVSRLIPSWFFESPLILAARHPWWALVILVPVMAAAGFAVAASGLIPLKASAGHWAITQAILQFSKSRSIATHAIGIDVPPLDDPELLLRGAGHFDLGCRPCHGSVRGDIPRIPQAMLPPPPALTVRAIERSPAELFYVVKHGLKFTGMPAWPTQQRDDEVWAVVAFLRQLPTLERDDYRKLTGADTSGPPVPEIAALDPAEDPPPAIVVEICARCHGVDGTGRGVGAFPKLAGQRAEYMARALRAYAVRERHSGIMGPIAAAMTPAAREQAATYYASRPLVTQVNALSEAALRGREIAERGIPHRDVPACAECHGPSTTEKNEAYPILAGQYAGYVAHQLALLKQRRRGGSEYVHLMHSFVDRLNPGQADDVAAYYQHAPVR